MSSVEDSIKEIHDVFSFFQDPMEKIEQLIDYGKLATGIPENLKTDENKARKLLQEYSIEMLDRHKSLATIKIVPRFKLNSSGKIVREV